MRCKIHVKTTDGRAVEFVETPDLFVHGWFPDWSKVKELTIKPLHEVQVLSDGKAVETDATTQVAQRNETTL